MIEQGYADAALRRGATFLRLPGAVKLPDGQDMLRPEPPLVDVSETSKKRGCEHTYMTNRHGQTCQNCRGTTCSYS